MKRMPPETLQALRKLARKEFNRLRLDPDFSHSHPSHAASRALENAEAIAGTDQTAHTFGVEGFAEYGGCTYLNTGDGYAPTVYFRRGRFCIGCWADIVEQRS